MNQNFNNEPNFGTDESVNNVSLSNVQEDINVNAEVDKNFGKALAATIMAEFPITSIIAIFMGHKAWKNAWSIDESAKARGARVPGKNIASKVLSAYGKGAGILCTVLYSFLTVIYGFYFLMLIALMFAEM